MPALLRCRPPEHTRYACAADAASAASQRPLRELPRGAPPPATLSLCRHAAGALNGCLFVLPRPRCRLTDSFHLRPAFADFRLMLLISLPPPFIAS